LGEVPSGLNELALIVYNERPWASKIIHNDAKQN